MNAFVISTASVALAEFGDKTQLLALVLAAKYRRPWVIALGILLATLANHALAGAFGALVAQWFAPQTLRWLVAASFLAVAAWTLIPDKIDESGSAPRRGNGVLLATIIAFFLAEIGDKTQIATAVLGAQYHPLWQVIAGTTCGMLIADVPAVWLGARFAHALPLRATRLVAATLFAALALWIALG
ncbi:MAG: TMEM165/GDT1 family protein [Proteobacteria bacterium]|nr:TMEM165/GDT1 family protein [Pseudomonadota bacterium]